ncbi:MAG: OmpA family protein [Burkholderiales bacterium]|nr:OmpA family protein [Burkholderiales bacterium]
MNRLHTLQRCGLAGLGALLAAATLPARAQDDSYFYGGASVGQSRARIDDPGITASLLGAGLATTTMSHHQRDTGFKVFGGYQFNRYLGLEAGYFNLGKFGFTSTTVPAGTLDGQIKLQGLNLDLVGTLPLTERLSAIGRVGAQYAKASDRFGGSGAVTVLNPTPSQRATNFKLGAGLQYELTRSLFLRGEFERYRVNDAVGHRGDVNLVSVGLVIPFGRAPEAAPQIALAPPVYAAPAPEPAPEPAPVAVVPAPVAPPAPLPVPIRRVAFSADSLFAFDRSEVQPAGRQALDRFARELDGTRYDVIQVEGYTDRLGPAAYNQALSTRRAEAVKAYLVGPGGIDAGKVSAVGRGASSPVTKPGDCQGVKARAKLIACLQPDRRVEVEVSGTR